MKIGTEEINRAYQAITGEKREKFELFRALLLEYNQKYNLTTILEEEEMLYKHFLDSVVGEKAFFSSAKVVEVGSGAGFPSIPLKIVREDLTFTLIESTGKKCEFLNVAVDKLNLKGVTVLNARAEDIGKREETREKFDVCCARAVARMNTLAEYCMPLVKKGGFFVAYKGLAEEELKESEKALKVLGGGKTEKVSYSLPNGYGERTIIIVQKVENTPQKYPRGNGKERKSPIL